MKHLAFLLCLVWGLSSSANDSLTDRFDYLGGSEDTLDQAASFDPDNKVRVVQERYVDRNYRLEFGLRSGLVAAGDSYLSTHHLGANIDFHFSSRWSVGLRYTQYFNELTAEGESRYQTARQEFLAGNHDYLIPDVDFPIASYALALQWYPIYGKTSLLDWAISHFDIYILGEAGQIQLSSGPTARYALGTGVGLWLSQHLTTRFEIQFQNYQDIVLTGERDVNTVVGTVSLGWLL